MRKRTMLTAGAAALAVGVAGCGGSSSSSGGGPQSTGPGPKAPEGSPPGDIPDNQAYLRFAPASGGFTVKVPEGWSRSSGRGTTTFTDKLNAIRVETAGASAPLT